MVATSFDDLVAQVTIPEDGTISRTIFQDDQVKVVLFGFAAGQELSEHTASTAAILHIVQGHATVGLDIELLEAGPNAWIHMPPRMPHSIKARTPVVMLLILLKAAAG
ncbi:MAG: cupin domain-containing protein [Oscillochloridaceae bacterium umkhey_bin13]